MILIYIRFTFTTCHYLAEATLVSGMRDGPSYNPKVRECPVIIIPLMADVDNISLKPLALACDDATINLT
jgi:hypothetical protein